MQLTGFLHFNNIPTKEKFRISKGLPTGTALYSLIQQPMSVSYGFIRTSLMQIV